MKKIILIINLFGFLYCNEIINDYNINLYGIKVADCTMSIKDTTIYNQ